MSDLDNLKEDLILKLKPHRLSFFSFYFLAFFILVLSFQANKLISFFISFLIILFIEIYRMALSYFIYRDKIIKIFKFLIVNETIVYYKQIQDIFLTQNILERIFNLGKININTAGSDKVELILEGVKRPKEVKNQIESLIGNLLNKNV